MVFLTFCALVTFASTLSAIQEMPAPVPGSVLLDEAEALILAGPAEATETSVLGILERARGQFRSIDDPALAAYWLSRTALLEGMLYNQQEEERRATRILEDGLTLSERALANGPFSDGLRVQSDLHSQMMFARGLFYMIRNADDARDSALTALEREPDNVRAHISTAGYFLNAPPVAGGDPEEAERLVRRALTLTPTRNERFILQVMLAQILHKLGDTTGAGRALAGAEAIFPGSPWLVDVREEIGTD